MSNWEASWKKSNWAKSTWDRQQQLGEIENWANTGNTSDSHWSASATSSSLTVNASYYPAVAHSLDPVAHSLAGASGHLDPLRLSRRQDKPQQAQWYHINLPPVGYLVVRFDLDTIRFEEHAMMSQTLTDFKYLVHVFCTAGHQSGVRSPLYHLTASLKRAQERAEKGALFSKQFEHSTVVALDLWKLCEQGILTQDLIIDLRTTQAQEAYFADSPLAKTVKHSMRWQTKYQEMVVMWKGSLVDHMITIDDNGDPTGLFREELIENDTWGSYSWTPEVAAFVESIAGAGLETGAGAGTGAGLETRAAEDAQPADGATSAVTPHPPREDPPAGSAPSPAAVPILSTTPTPPPAPPPPAPPSPKPSPPLPPCQLHLHDGKSPPATKPAPPPPPGLPPAD